MFVFKVNSFPNKKKAGHVTYNIRAESDFDMTDIFYKREISSYYIIYIAFLCFMNNITNHYFTLKSLRIDFSVDKI